MEADFAAVFCLCSTSEHNQASVSSVIITSHVQQAFGLCFGRCLCLLGIYNLDFFSYFWFKDKLQERSSYLFISSDINLNNIFSKNKLTILVNKKCYLVMNDK